MFYSPAISTPNQERRPFAPLNQFLGLSHSNSQPGPSSHQNYLQPTETFNPNSEKFPNHMTESYTEKLLDVRMPRKISDTTRQQVQFSQNFPFLC